MASIEEMSKSYIAEVLLHEPQSLFQRDSVHHSTAISSLDSHYSFNFDPQQVLNILLLHTSSLTGQFH